jgi:hypothetical protein
MRIGFDEVAKRMAARNKKPEDFVGMRFLDELEKGFYKKIVQRNLERGVWPWQYLSTVRATRPAFKIVTKLSRLTQIPSCDPNSQDPARNQ